MSASIVSDRPRCCERLGLDFGDGPVCFQHQTDEQRRLAWSLERRAARLGLEPVEWRRGSPIEWPYGLGRPGAVIADRVALLDWMETNRLRPAKKRGRRMDTARITPDLHWLRGEICPARTGHAMCAECRSSGFGWMDHTSGWIRSDGVRVLVSQPYGLSEDDYAHLARLDAEPDLRVHIDHGGWYGANFIVSVWAGEDAAATALAEGLAEYSRTIAEMFAPQRVNEEADQ